MSAEKIKQTAQRQHKSQAGQMDFGEFLDHNAETPKGDVAVWGSEPDASVSPAETEPAATHTAPKAARKRSGGKAGYIPNIPKQKKVEANLPFFDDEIAF